MSTELVRAPFEPCFSCDFGKNKRELEYTRAWHVWRFQDLPRPVCTACLLELMLQSMCVAANLGGAP